MMKNSMSQLCPVFNTNRMIHEYTERFYVLLGYENNRATDLAPILENQIVAYDRTSLNRLWSTNDWQDGEDGLRDITFLTAPTLFGERLLVPTLKRGTYALQCLDRTPRRGSR